MGLNVINAKMLSKMFLAGAKNLEQKKEWINELNVFPVPGFPSIRIFRLFVNPYFCSLFRFLNSLRILSTLSKMSSEVTKSDSLSDGIVINNIGFD